MKEEINSQRKEIVSSLLNSRAVDFEAIGKAVAELGPTRALANEPWDEFCWTMRQFVHVFRGPDPRLDLGRLEELRELAANLRR